MREVQKQVKEVSKTISQSPLYQHAMGGRDQTLPYLAPAFPSMSGGYASGYSTGPPSSGSSHIPSIPATPLSAALGPAAHATVASTPNSSSHRDYFPDIPFQHPGARTSHERSDTVMNGPKGSLRRQMRGEMQ